MAQELEGLEDFLENEMNDDILYRERERRHAELKAVKEKQRNGECHGTITECPNESAILTPAFMSSHARLLIHFHRFDFKRCQEMSMALRALAERHLSVKIVQVEATRAPFLVDCWGIKMLPCVVRIDDGEAVDKIVGFEDVCLKGGEMDFAALEKRLILDAH